MFFIDFYVIDDKYHHQGNRTESLLFKEVY